MGLCRNAPKITLSVEAKREGKRIDDFRGGSHVTDTENHSPFGREDERQQMGYLSGKKYEGLGEKEKGQLTVATVCLGFRIHLRIQLYVQAQGEGLSEEGAENRRVAESYLI